MTSMMRCANLELHNRRLGRARRARGTHGPAACKRKVAMCSTSTRLGTTTSVSSLSQLVSESLEAGAGHPFVGIKSLVDPAVAFDGPLVQLRGDEAYLQNATFWFERQQSWLPESQCQVLRVSQVAPYQVLVRWRLTWIRPGSHNLVKLGRALPGVEVKFKDLLDRYDQEVKVTWKAVFKLLKKVVQERVLEVSIAAIEGTTTFDFKEVPSQTTTLTAGSSGLSKGTASPSPESASPLAASQVGQTPATISSSSSSSPDVTAANVPAAIATPSGSTTGSTTVATTGSTAISTTGSIPPSTTGSTASGASSSASQPAPPSTVADSSSPAESPVDATPTPPQYPLSPLSSSPSTAAATPTPPPSLLSPLSSPPTAVTTPPTPTPPPPATYVLCKSTEFVDLLPLLLSKKVKNRLVAKDLLLMLYIRQPLGWSFEEWFQHVGEQVDVTDVPGIGGFDVDGLSTEEKAERFEDATAALALGTFATLLVAFAFGWKYMSRWMF